MEILVIRSVHITPGVDDWINDFRDKMRKEHHQEVHYTSMINLLTRFGIMVLMKPEKLTDEQREYILECIKEANDYEPTYPKIRWLHEFEVHFVPKILGDEHKKPWEK